jgi:hypothetical protein
MFSHRMQPDQATSSFYIHIDACNANMDAFAYAGTKIIGYSATITHTDRVANSIKYSYLANSLANCDRI